LSFKNRSDSYLVRHDPLAERKETTSGPTTQASCWLRISAQLLEELGNRDVTHVDVASHKLATSETA
jgi:hypothetical protein